MRPRLRNMIWPALLLLHALSTNSSAGARERKTPLPAIPSSRQHIGHRLLATSRRDCSVRHRHSIIIGDGRVAVTAAFIIRSPGAVSERVPRCDDEIRSIQHGITHRPMAKDVLEVDTPDAGAGDIGKVDAVYDGEDELVDRGLRFSGVGRLYANKDATITTDVVLDRLSSATVAIIGLGGVGSWAAESLCRSGVGNLVLVDLDDICISNTNRQLHATSSAVGRMKIDVMEARLSDINPACNVTLIHDFVTADTATNLLRSILPTGLTACIDAIDGTIEKTALILACVDLGIPIVTCGGAAGRMDPTKIVVDDLTRVQEDRLLFSCRKLLRQKHGFPKVQMPGGRGQKKHRVRSWRVPAVYSTEVQQKAPAASSGEANDSVSSFRTCDGALGTASFVTGTYGFVAACKVVEMIALDKLVVPKRQGKGGSEHLSKKVVYVDQADQ